MSEHAPRLPQAGPRPWLPWLVVSLLGLALAALAAAWAPKMVGLFLIGFGLLAGAVSGTLARAFQVRGRAVVPLSALLITTSLVGLTLRTHQIWAERTRAIIQSNDAPPVLLPPSESLEGLPDDIRRTFESAAVAQRPDLRFPAYLKDRTSPLGTWPWPWPALFWGAEIVAGTAAGTWLARRLAAASALIERREDG